jgi:transposase
MPHDQRYECAYIFGAVCPSRDTGVALILPDADIPAMNLHLKAISAHIKKDSHAAIIIDGAGWHKEGGTLFVPHNITLIRLPSYCPELNAQENVWEYLRPNFLAGKVFDTYDDIVNGCCIAWNELIATTGKIKSIASRGWLVSSQVIL